MPLSGGKHGNEFLKIGAKKRREGEHLLETGLMDNQGKWHEEHPSPLAVGLGVALERLQGPLPRPCGGNLR